MPSQVMNEMRVQRPLTIAGSLGNGVIGLVAPDMYNTTDCGRISFRSNAQSSGIQFDSSVCDLRIDSRCDKVVSLWEEVMASNVGLLSSSLVLGRVFTVFKGISLLGAFHQFQANLTLRMPRGASLAPPNLDQVDARRERRD